MSVQILQGDCIQVMKALKDDSVDSVCCDPPYELGFMGRKWDASGIAYNVHMWEECLRVLKPGGHLLAFGGTRTYHRMACAIEDAGFEIRDSLHWIYGTGFPKSMDVAKAIDKAARGVPQGGADPTSANHGKYKTQATEGSRGDGDSGRGYGAGPGQFMREQGERDDRELAAEAQEWDGWGTALKPAHEPIVLARKLLTGTVAANVLEYGTGGLNVDGCRVGTADDLNGGAYAKNVTRRDDGWGMQRGGAGKYEQPTGRWPPNILLTHDPDCAPTGNTRKVKNGIGGPKSKGFGDYDTGIFGSAGGQSKGVSRGYPTQEVEVWDCVDGCPVAEMDRQSGITKSSGGVNSGKLGVRVFGKFANETIGQNAGGLGDTGGASRLFPCFKYQAKAAKKERPVVDGINHPTVKPVALMQWLVRLITPPGGICLDPFAGTGTTGEACLEEGFNCILIEREPDYIKLIKARLGKREPTLWD